VKNQQCQTQFDKLWRKHRRTKSHFIDWDTTLKAFCEVAYRYHDQYKQKTISEIRYREEMGALAKRYKETKELYFQEYELQ